MRKIVIGLAVVAGLALGLSLPVLAGRTAGTYTLPNTPTVRNPVSAGQVITKELWNGTFGDVANALTDSLDRTSGGAGDMARVLWGVDGTSSGPMWSFTTSHSTGVYSPATGHVGLSASGTPIVATNSAGTLLYGSPNLWITGGASGVNLSASGPISVASTGNTITMASAGAMNLGGGAATTLTASTGNTLISAAAGNVLLSAAHGVYVSAASGNVIRFSVAGANTLTVAGNSIAAVNTYVPSVPYDLVTKSYLEPNVMSASWTLISVSAGSCSSGSLYYAKRNGVVFVRGSASMANPGSCSFTLPAGFLPAGDTGVACSPSGGTGVDRAVGAAITAATGVLKTNNPSVNQTATCNIGGSWIAEG